MRVSNLEPEIGGKMLRWIHKHSVLVIALTAYLAMASMLIYQAHVIDSQRVLIQQLFGDSLELNARKVHDLKLKNGSATAAPAARQ